MNIFAIETSCDETSAAIVKDGIDVQSLTISSQIKIHSEFFGVVPELASRAHTENINWVLGETIKKAGFTFKDFEKKIDAVAWTAGPGLAGALLVGAVAAKSLASVFKKPSVSVNHLEGHLYSAFINQDDQDGGKKNIKIKFPFLGMIISGGHTEMIAVEDFGKYKILGQTRDDAAGEAFDKAAKMLGLFYPGGPIIDKKAQKGRADYIFFTRPYLKDSYDFSFSGIKTALLNYLKKNPLKNEKELNNICASFRQAIAETLCFKAFKAAKDYKIKNIALGGGVCANSLIRKMFLETAAKNNIKVFMPNLLYSADNAAMIGSAAYYKIKKIGFCKDSITMSPNLKLESWSNK
ncbi:MAG: tRNA (adenosine(37)-N6)-threonylcarbamoyltransferase complex transferase subunit TsaD [Elusimicrobiota bacterium]|jgi:N6-L-threonylcarbamoyladenine synthase|nr:tRNA (adenosine(37)-N6)-threonylcarbamoyltransferase complex transferase subunit TsaD [Elusimicrobiota bacterium]